MTLTTGPQVLVIGLDPHRVRGDLEPKPFADSVAVGLQRFMEHGVELETCLIGLDDQGDDDLAAATAALASREWQCVVVGSGLRTTADKLTLFEDVVNLVRRNAPRSPIAFNRSPADTFDAVSRWIDPDD